MLDQAHSFLSEILPAVRNFVAQQSGLSHHDQEDVISLVVEDFLKKCERGKINLELNVTSYFYQLIRWRVTDKIRENTRRANTYSTIGAENDLDTLPRPKKFDKKTRIEILREALIKVYKDKKARKGTCSDRDCEIYSLTVFGGKSADEISEKLNTAKGIVFLARHRVGRKVQEKIKQMLKTDGL